MPNVHDEPARDALRQRLAQLEPTAKARWGSFDAARMLAHVNDGIRSATGDLAVAAKQSPLRYFPLNIAIVRWLPFPKNAPTAPELVSRKPAQWSEEVASFGRLLDELARKPLSGSWPEHAAFGRLSGSDWSLLQWRHIDHHFRQFGV